MKGKQINPLSLPSEISGQTFVNRLRSISIEKSQFPYKTTPGKRMRNKSIDYIANKRKEMKSQYQNPPSLEKNDVSLVTYLACQNNRLLNYLEAKNEENQELSANIESLSFEIQSLTDEGQFLLGEDAKVVMSQNENLREILNEKESAIESLKEKINNLSHQLSDSPDLSFEAKTQKSKVEEAQAQYNERQNILKSLYSKISEFTNINMKRRNQVTNNQIQNLRNQINSSKMHFDSLKETKKILLQEINGINQKISSFPKAKSINDYIAENSEMKTSIMEMKSLIKSLGEYISQSQANRIMNSIVRVNKDRLSLQLKNK